MLQIEELKMIEMLDKDLNLNVVSIQTLRILLLEFSYLVVKSLSLSLYYFLLKLISIGKTVHKSLPEGTGYAAL